MKIAIVYYRITYAGGLERRLINYAEYFLKKGNEVHVYYVRKDASVKLSSQIVLHRVPVFALHSYTKMAQFGKKTEQILKRERFDFSLSLMRTPGADALICPGTHRGYMQATGKPWTRKDYMQDKMDEEAYKRSKLILAASEMMRKELTDLYNVPSSGIKVLYPPLRAGDFRVQRKKERSALRKQYGLSAGRKTFLFVSYSHSRKGLPLLLELFRSLEGRELELLIAGTAPGVSLPVNVRYAGYVKDMEGLYAASDFLIHPAIYEPFGQIVSESLQMQLPVIVSDRTGAGELIGEDEGMVVGGLEFKDWSDAVERALSRSWNIAPDFAFRNGLTVAQHVEKMMEIVSELRHPAL